MSKDRIVYPYVPNSVPAIKAQMLKEVGAKDIMDLYAEIPEHLRLQGRLNLPEPILDEYSLRRHVEELLNKNKNCSAYLSFLGAGCAQHFVPAVCDEINGRGEFLTAYAMDCYADHGKWQATFEYNSLLAELLDMDVVSNPLYDGPSAAATSLRMAARITGRKEVLVPKYMSPDMLLVIQNYLQGIGGPLMTITRVEADLESGLLDLDDLKAKISPQTAAVFIENPAYLGYVETHQAAKIGEIARDHGAEFVVYTDPIALGILAPPAQYGATIVCGDSHALGMHMQCGGGQCGFFATHDDMKYIAEYKDLIWGLAETDMPGEYGFGQVLFNRTSYGSREKGIEFTGTSTGLWGITAAVYLSLMGPQGIWEVGQTISQNAEYAAKQITAIKGVALKFNAPFFKEFVVNFDGTGRSVREINKRLLEFEIFGGKDISAEFPELGQSALYCVTETKSVEDIEKLSHALRHATE
ncbi:MAG: aminomethyl-transferring glycine dehydrogenase subunit GcvPA [Desulfobacterales bacterium]|nr:MAG: aminomethyl-transferring glycine dehydrogenase subunit GcvPA [Desulfobacterales bacterium]